MRKCEKIRIWDNHNKQWLEPMAIFFDKNGKINRVTAVIPGNSPLDDGWYDIKGADLRKIAIKSLGFNTQLIPCLKKN